MTKISQAKERAKEEIIAVLHPLVKEWFFSKFEDFSLPQKYGVMNVWERKNTLISAPTGGTKTLTSFLSIINYLIILAEKKQLEDKVYAIYCSPLKALSNDIHKNLLEPLEEIRKIAEKKDIKLQEIRVALRTGDTEAKERAKQAKKIPHILITTPESLTIVLTSPKFVENLKAVEFCIIDEIHAMDNKRGTYLSLTLERLNSMSAIWPVKIGLSATIEPLEEVARFLVGESHEREVEIANVQFSKKIDIAVLTPVNNLVEDRNLNHEMYQLLNKLIKEHKTTLIFTNTRSATERVVHNLKEKFPTEYGEDIAAHHSSLAKTHRFNIEERLRDGKLRVVVCSTSLELGIDIGYIDLVIMLGSPKSSARAIQRLGRAGHRLHETIKGRFLVMDRDDLVECSVIQKEIIEHKINKVNFPKSCLDVLSQQIFGMAISRVWKSEEMLDTIRKSYCYKDLSKEDFMSVISYLSGEYGLENNNVYAKIWYDKTTKEIGKRGKLARVIFMTNLGTIPDESFIEVKLAPSGEHIGVIDEGFLERMKKGDVFVLGGSKYIYLYTRGMNLYVRGTVDRPPTIPSWFSETLPLSFDSALEINRFRQLILEKFESKQNKKEILEFISSHLHIPEEGSQAIYSYFLEQYEYSSIPNTKLITIENYKAEKNYIIVNSMYGRRVNDALSRALGYVMGHYGNRDIEMGISDNGFYFAGERLDIEKAIKELKPEDLKTILEEAVNKTDILARRFRHCASRSLMILRNYKGINRSVGKQQIKSHFLLASVKKISKDFPILKEAKREVLEDLMDIKNAKQVLEWIREGKIKIKQMKSRLPSPFALNMVLQGHTDFLRIEDKQDFLKRMHELHLSEIKSRK
ncbi:ATP-dependent helicase [Candidatus Pacearchaeota archaeon]|nr:ATP-dependent helicase [Candidatus Pacearchaeota archaeon]